MKNHCRAYPIQVYAHCNCGLKRASNTTSPNRTLPRIACPVPSCKSNFSRPSDLARHQKSIHGPKTECAYAGCGYTTGRADKMSEHVRKRHRTAGEFEPEFLLGSLSLPVEKQMLIRQAAQIRMLLSVISGHGDRPQVKSALSRSTFRIW